MKFSPRAGPRLQTWSKCLPLRRLRSAPWWPLGAPLLLYGVLCTLAVLILPSQARGGQILIRCAHTVAALWAAAACYVALRELSADDPALCRPWRLCIAALLCWTASVFIRLGVDFLRLSGTSGAALADVLWCVQQALLAVVLWQLAQLALTRPKPMADRLRVFMDAALVALAVLVLLWTTFSTQRGMQEPAALLVRLMAFYHPLADIMVLSGALLLFFAARGRLHLTRAAALILLGVTALVGANTIYFYLTLHQQRAASGFLIGAAPDIGWIWACVLIGAGALAHSTAGAAEMRVAAKSRQSMVPDESTAPLSDEKPQNADEAEERHWQQVVAIWLPYGVSLGIALLLIYNEYRMSSRQSVQHMLPALWLLLAIVARQMLTLADNFKLSESLRSANLSLAEVNTDLERNVQDRTQHLAMLHGITSTLNTSLDRRTVLRVALERTIAATGADGGGIWLRGSEAEVPSGNADEEHPDDNRFNWQLAHAHGFGKNDPLQVILRDLAVAAAEDHQTPAALLGSTYLAPSSGFTPSPQNVILVPIRWGGALLGALGLLRHRGEFSHDDRALAESVALETGTALQNARLYQEARHRADRDSVTALLNHRAMQERLNASLGLSRRHKVELSVVMMDLNNFKFFNDTYGHPVGDEVLRTVARHLRELCRENDIVGRYGGDEFIVLLPDTGSEGTREFCGRVAARLNEHHFQADSGSRIPIEMSFGWAVYPRDADSPLELLALADSNLYEYKHSGGFRNASHAEAAEQGRIEIRKLKNRAAGGSFGVLDALVTAIDNKDRYTRRHSEEVTHYSLLVAKELGYSEEALRAVRISGLLHDVGKIAVPDEILRHPGQLDAEEWDIMKQHPVFGALIVKDLPHLDEVLGGVRHHHERWDGKGYPDALKETDIPMMGRLLAVGDCFSAMTTNRPYRKAFAPEDALREIERSIGIQFDPHIAQTFITVMRRELSGTCNLQDAVPTISSEEMREEISRDVLVATP
jgi:diguanylate cyclase (GGDEF)-like protein/putative nucleotidyltransferase with HDIG domain